MKSGFRKISRVGGLTGGTKWYLSDDCLLAAKRMMYVVEYRRFYLHDLECIVVWPSRSWRYRLIIPGVLFTVISACLWRWVDATAGQVFLGIGLAWTVLELALGPTASSRIRTTGITIDLPLVGRTRRASKVLAKIDAEIRASRDVTVQSAGPADPTKSEAASAVRSIADISQTNGF